MIFAQNPNAFRDYQILEKIEAGLKLKGFEAKAIKQGKISLKGSYITFQKNTPYLINCHIAPYQQKNVPSNYQPDRPRILLLKKKEIKYLLGKLKEKGLTLIPVRVYNKNNLIKIEIAVAKGLRKSEKKEKLKEKEFQREKERFLKKISRNL